MLNLIRGSWISCILCSRISVATRLPPLVGQVRPARLAPPQRLRNMLRQSRWFTNLFSRTISHLLRYPSHSLKPVHWRPAHLSVSNVIGPIGLSPTSLLSVKLKLTYKPGATKRPFRNCRQTQILVWKKRGPHSKEHSRGLLYSLPNLRMENLDLGASPGSTLLAVIEYSLLRRHNARVPSNHEDNQLTLQLSAPCDAEAFPLEPQVQPVEFIPHNLYKYPQIRFCPFHSSCGWAD